MRSISLADSRGSASNDQHSTTATTASVVSVFSNLPLHVPFHVPHDAIKAPSCVSFWKPFSSDSPSKERKSCLRRTVRFPQQKNKCWTRRRRNFKLVTMPTALLAVLLAAWGADSKKGTVILKPLGNWSTLPALAKTKHEPALSLGERKHRPIARPTEHHPQRTATVAVVVQPKKFASEPPVKNGMSSSLSPRQQQEQSGLARKRNALLRPRPMSAHSFSAGAEPEGGAGVQLDVSRWVLVNDEELRPPPAPWEVEARLERTKQKISTDDGKADDDTHGVFQPLPPHSSDARVSTRPRLPPRLGSFSSRTNPFMMSTDQQQEAQPAVTSEGGEEGGDRSAVYYYDPTHDEVTGPGDPPLQEGASHPAVLPEVVYDLDGNAVSLADLTTEGETTEIFVEHAALQGDDESAAGAAPWSSSEVGNSTSSTNSGATSRNTAKTSRNTAKIGGRTSSSDKFHINATDWENMPQAQDQMIIVSTVATMALLVGALSARRLRSRQFLSSCIENESLEDDLAFDTRSQYDYDGGSGGRSIMAGNSAQGYDTFASGGNPPWRGDLEKFDV